MADRWFDMEEYIHKRMLEIKNLEDRSLFRQVVEEALLKVHDYVRQAYQELEEKVLEECQSSQKHYTIYTTITTPEKYDATDSFLYPMRSEDIKKTKLFLKDICKGIKKGEEQRLYTIFLKGSATNVYGLLNEDYRVFTGIVKTTHGEYRAGFCLRQNKEYLEMIKELYSVFDTSCQPWTTVCTAYLNKLFDVYLVNCERIKENEEIVQIQPDFEEYTELVEYDVIPLWNLRPIIEKSSTYPNPCIDKINYEHQIFSQRLNPECEYLIRNTDVEITNIRRLQGDLYITCPEEKPCEWQLYEINLNRKKGNYPNPILSNQYKDSFSGNITEMYRKSIKTKGEMARLVEAFDYKAYIKFHDFYFCDSIPKECISANYNMDTFISDELRENKPGQLMVVEFKAEDPENYLNEDVMSFLVTQLQKILPDFFCAGKLV